MKRVLFHKSVSKKIGKTSNHSFDNLDTQRVYLFCIVSVPSWLTKITEKIHESTGLFPSAINHVLINEYHPDQGIMVPHPSSQSLNLLT